MPQETRANPEGSRRGNKSLPKIPSKTYRISNVAAGAQIAGASTVSLNSTLYIEIEGPNPDHGVMKEDEPHIGIAFGRDVKLNAAIDEHKVELVQVPENELKVNGEKNPVRKSTGLIWIQFKPVQAGMLSKAIELLLAAYEPNVF